MRKTHGQEKGLMARCSTRAWGDRVRKRGHHGKNLDDRRYSLDEKNQNRIRLNTPKKKKKKNPEKKKTKNKKKKKKKKQNRQLEPCTYPNI